MTPFGIRKRIKKLLGRAPAPQAPATPRYPVTFVLPDGETYQAEAKQDDTLVLTSGRGPRPIATGCADSTCGTCRVEVLEGADKLSPPSEHELNTKAANDVPHHMRLGCQTRVLGAGVKVKVINVFDADAFA